MSEQVVVVVNMILADLLRETMDVTELEAWENERIPNALTGVGVRLHLMGLSLRETAAVLDLLGVDRSHQAIFQWTHQLADSAPDPPSAAPTRVAVDETAVRVASKWYWLYAAVDLDSKLLLGVELSRRRGR